VSSYTNLLIKSVMTDDEIIALAGVGY